MSLTVLQVLPALEVGGVERGTLEVAAELVRKGHRSLVMSAGGRMVDQLLRDGSEHITLPVGKKSPLTLLCINKLRKIIYDENISIVHARSRMPAWIAYLAWRGLDEKTRPKFVTTVHGPYTVNPYSAVMTYGEKVIAISEFIKKYVIDSYPGVNENKIKVIHRGIDPELYTYDFKPDEKWLKQWGSDYPQLQNKFLVTLPARITHWKGHEDFIQIIATLIGQGLPVHGIIAGGYENKRKNFYNLLQKSIQEKDLNNHVTFIGHRNDLKEILSVSNVVLSLAKIPEAFGRTALEALSLGTPVIAYNHGGASEVLNKIFPAGLVEANNINAAASKINNFYNSKEKPEEHNYFTLDKMLEDTLNVYYELTK